LANPFGSVNLSLRNAFVKQGAPLSMQSFSCFGSIRAQWHNL